MGAEQGRSGDDALLKGTRPLSSSLTDRILTAPNPVRQEEPSAVAVMVRTANALHRLNRLAEAMEHVADEGERQLAIVRGRL
jgi:hypothetical protein